MATYPSAHPDDEIVRLMSRPGDAACAASLLATISAGVLYVVVFINNEMFFGSGIRLSDALVICILVNGGAVMAPCFVMALGSQWRPESDWIGVLGRVLAIGWVLTFLAAGLLV
jgi:hypothetical protein